MKVFKGIKVSAGLAILIILAMAACAPADLVRTYPVHEADTMALSGYVYNLPRTSFRLEIEVVKTRIIRGPYYRFAEKFLSLEDVPERNSNSCRISNVRLESFEEADPEQVFLVRQVSGQTDLSGLVGLSREGLIFNDRSTTHSSKPVELSTDRQGGPVFTDLSIEKNTAMSIDTFYKTILTDTSFIRVPVMKEQLLVKTIDEKAREAADFILELRYERFMMLSGNNSTPMPDYAVKRLDEIEQEYLELFIGKTFDERYRYTYYITPSGEEVFENIEVLEFSGSRGVVPGGSDDSQVLSVEFRKLGNTALLKDPSRTDILPVKNNALYYRVPDLADTRVNLGGRTLLYDRYQVSQFGEILSLPVTTPQSEKVFGK